MQHVQHFRNTYGQAAIDAAKGSRIFPETIIAAAALESNWGRSKLSSQFNNFFGIKADKSWKGKTVTMRTREVINGKTVYIDAPFRHYDNAKESFLNYVRFVSGPRYVRAGVLSANTFEEQIQAIKDAGYATDPNYVSTLKGVLKTLGGYLESTKKYLPLLSIILVSVGLLLIIKNSIK